MYGEVPSTFEEVGPNVLGSAQVHDDGAGCEIAVNRFLFCCFVLVILLHFFNVFCDHFNLALFFALQQRHVATCRHVVDDGAELFCYCL